MAVSLEAREPLLDHRLVEFAASLPEKLRIRRGQGKWLLKQAMRRYLPEDILFRPKQGFVMPIAEWLRGPLAKQTRAIVTSATLAQTGWFDEKRMKQMAEDHIAGSSDHSRLLWQMMMLDHSLDHLAVSS
jgi:asparagine synthase (glutamine-hydrolysing)